jgi:histidinol dehydrogenase
MSVIGLDPGPFGAIGPHAVRLAELEGLHGHARSVAVRLERDRG